MWRVSSLLACLVFIVSAGIQAAEPPAAQRAPAARGWTIGEPVRHANLTIFPVISDKPKTEDRFITLDEGLKTGTVEIVEVQAEQPSPASRQDRSGNALQRSGGGSEVNRLMIVNKSGKSLYLMPGEIIIGGKQDRTIGRELVIAPTKTPVPIEVFCVEHGRWGNRREDVSREIISAATGSSSRNPSVTIGPSTPAQAAQEANSGKFIGSVGNLSKSARATVQSGKGQQAVWEEVDKVNAKSGVKASSGAFTGNYAESQVVKRLDPYLDQLLKPVAETNRVIGVIVAIDGKVDSFDVFESTPLFQKLWPKLLKGYSLDAANASGDPKPGSKVCSRDGGD